MGGPGSGVKHKEGSPPVDERIRIICEMMRSLTWERGKSAKVLAAQWGVDEKTVEGNSATASRMVKAEVMDPDAVRVDVGSALSRVLRSALAEDDRRSVIQAASTWATIAGANAPTRTENVNVDTGAATPAEAKRIMRELFGSVTPTDADGDEQEDTGEPEGEPSDE